jgi:hypothetical protein
MTVIESLDIPNRSLITSKREAHPGAGNDHVNRKDTWNQSLCDQLERRSMHLLVATLNECGPEKLLRSSSTSTFLDCWASPPLHPQLPCTCAWTIPLFHPSHLFFEVSKRHPDPAFTRTKAHHLYCYTRRRWLPFPPLHCPQPPPTGSRQHPRSLSLTELLLRLPCIAHT